MMKVERICVDSIDVGERLRPIGEAAVLSLVDSIKRVGLLQPIAVYSPLGESTVLLVAGAHRLEAIKRLGMREIDAVFVTGDEVERELREIAENLHRAELTALERSNQIARWAELTAARVAQVAPPGGRQPKEKGIRKVASELGIDRRDVERAVTVASISEEAQQAAKDAGLDNNRTALLAVAKEAPEAQVAKVSEISKAKAEAKTRDVKTHGAPSTGNNPMLPRLQQCQNNRRCQNRYRRLNGSATTRRQPSS